MGVVIEKRCSIGFPAIKIASHAPGASAAGSGFDKHPTAETVEQENHLLVRLCGRKVYVGCISGTPIPAEAIPGAGNDRFADVAACRRNGVDQAVEAIAHVIHQGSRISVVPTLEAANRGVAGGQTIAAHVDNIGGWQQRHTGIQAVIIGVEREGHRLHRGACGHPGILRGMGIAPIAALHRFPIVSAGSWDRHCQ